MTRSTSSAASAAPPPGGDADPAQAPVSFRDAMGTAIEAARLADPVRVSADGRSFVSLPGDFALREIPDDLRLPAHVAARLEMDTRESLVIYANLYSDNRSILVADYDAQSIEAKLDWHPKNQADNFGTSGAARHSAILKLRPSEEYQRWDAMEGKLHPQIEFAAFLEENSVDIAHPEAMVMVEISRDLEAATGQTFKSANRLENGDRRFVFTSETHVMNDVVVPREFTLAIPLYQGEPPEELRAAFRYRATPEGLKLGFEWRRVEYQRQAHFRQIATFAAEGTGLPVVYGRLRG